MTQKKDKKVYRVKATADADRADGDEQQDNQFVERKERPQTTRNNRRDGNEDELNGIEEKKEGGTKNRRNRT